MRRPKSTAAPPSPSTPPHTTPTRISGLPWLDRGDSWRLPAACWRRTAAPRQTSGRAGISATCLPLPRSSSSRTWISPRNAVRAECSSVQSGKPDAGGFLGHRPVCSDSLALAPGPDLRGVVAVVVHPRLVNDPVCGPPRDQPVFGEGRHCLPEARKGLRQFLFHLPDGSRSRRLDKPAIPGIEVRVVHSLGSCPLASGDAGQRPRHLPMPAGDVDQEDRKSTRLNSS